MNDYELKRRTEIETDIRAAGDDLDALRGLVRSAVRNECVWAHKAVELEARAKKAEELAQQIEARTFEARLELLLEILTKRGVTFDRLEVGDIKIEGANRTTAFVEEALVRDALKGVAERLGKHICVEAGGCKSGDCE